MREQFTIHRPLANEDPFTVAGESTGAYSKRGRRYSTTASRTHDSHGRRIATNLTTGLISYKAEPDLPDSSDGLPLDETPSPEPDWSAAASNPDRAELSVLAEGKVVGGGPVTVTLAMMAARDTENPDNPIHSDPDEAKRAGLARPIAGGSHVLAFVLEAMMSELGQEVLLHGANFDIRWKAPTIDGSTIIPTATVLAMADDRVDFGVSVALEDGTEAMVGRITIPLVS